MPDPAILPKNIISVWYCINCVQMLEYPACPKCNPKQQTAPPPLGVSVTDVAGATGKIVGG